MGTRREARERAVQFLFQYDLNPPEDLGTALRLFWDSHGTGAPAADDEKAATAGTGEGPATSSPPEPAGPSISEAAIRLFAEPLVRGVIEHRPEIDGRLKDVIKNWEIHRLAAVDRNVLRLAIFEMLYRDDIPPVVSINEAVDIAKKFSTEDSGRFVNGVLDKIRTELMRPARIVK